MNDKNIPKMVNDLLAFHNILNKQSDLAMDAMTKMQKSSLLETNVTSFDLMYGIADQVATFSRSAAFISDQQNKNERFLVSINESLNSTFSGIDQFVQSVIKTENSLSALMGVSASVVDAWAELTSYKQAAYSLSIVLDTQIALAESISIPRMLFDPRFP